jgi:glyoxylase-like metal-dependent hydrolase (beta-lactamase superfamily II)
LSVNRISYIARFAAIATLLSGCAVHVPPELERPPDVVAVSTAGPNHSAIYIARVQSGVIVVDLGWWGAEKALAEGLAKLGASHDDVVAVFVTHSHRDHMAAWKSVRHAPFYIADGEVDLLFGQKPHGGWVPRIAEKLKKSDLPKPGEVTVRTFSSDTALVFGRDTVRAFPVPGHTAGSAAYLLRGQLFVGDAVGKSWPGGFREARGRFSEDVEQARLSLKTLRQRVAPYPVRTMCTAHLECTPVTDELWSELTAR